MTPDKTCHLCNTVLVYKLDDDEKFGDDPGTHIQFTAHDPDFCRDMMASRIRGLEGLLAQKVEACARAEHSLRAVMYLRHRDSQDRQEPTR